MEGSGELTTQGIAGGGRCWKRRGPLGQAAIDRKGDGVAPGLGREPGTGERHGGLPAWAPTQVDAAQGQGLKDTLELGTTTRSSARASQAAPVRGRARDRGGLKASRGARKARGAHNVLRPSKIYRAKRLPQGGGEAPHAGGPYRVGWIGGATCNQGYRRARSGRAEQGHVSTDLGEPGQAILGSEAER